jgi:hypothetical protein
MTKDDLERLKAELNLEDDGTCASKGDGVLIISGATGFTTGDSSLRSVTEQDLNRELEQACIATPKGWKQRQRLAGEISPRCTQTQQKMLLPSLPMTVLILLSPPTLMVFLLTPIIPISPSPLPLTWKSHAQPQLESPPPQSKAAQATTLF